ncbi:hypothetical protein TSPI_10769, partial [Trichinella spiralis]
VVQEKVTGVVIVVGFIPGIVVHRLEPLECMTPLSSVSSA